MKVTSQLISTALIRLLRDRHPHRGTCIGLDTLRQAWNATGLRARDLVPALQLAETAGIVRLHGDSFGGRVELTGHGAEVINSPADPAIEQDWIDDITLNRIRQRSLSAKPQPHRRATD